MPRLNERSTRPRARLCALLVAGGALLALPVGVAQAAPNCGSTTGLPSGSIAEGSWSSLQTAVANLNTGSATYYLTATIPSSSSSGASLSINSGTDVTLDLNGCSLTITSPGTGAAAIEVPSGAGLTIEDSSSSTLGDQGTLTATGGQGGDSYPTYQGSGAGIGGNGANQLATAGGVGGSVTIDGGVVYATGGSNSVSTDGGTAAGIGGGAGGYAANGGALAGTVTINGGSVTATGGGTDELGGAGAGIGGGGSGSQQGGNPAISGGALAGSVVVAGGNVYAYGGTPYDGGGGAGIGAGGGGANAYLSNGGGAGGTMSGSLTVSGGSLNAFGGAATDAGGGGAGIGGGGTGDDPNSVGAALTGSVDIENGSVAATGGGSTNAGSGAAVGGGGSEELSGSNGGAVTLSGGSLATTSSGNGVGVGGGSGYSGITGSPGTLTVASGDNGAPVISGEVDGGLSVDADAELSILPGASLALDGSNSNAGTFYVAGAITGSGTLANSGTILPSGAWSVDDKGPSAVAGATVTGNIYDVTFSVPAGSPPAAEWIFAAYFDPALPTINALTGYQSTWNSGSTVVNDSTLLSSVASNGTVALTETYTPDSGILIAPQGGQYGASGSITATAGGAPINISLSVDPSSGSDCTLANLSTGTTSTATVKYTGAGSCVIDAVQTGLYGTTTTEQQTFAIAKAPLTIIASSATVTAGAAPPTITASYDGLVNGDSGSSLATPPRCSSPVTSSSAVGSYTSTCSGAASPNYTIGYATGTVTVVKGTTTGAKASSKAALSVADKGLTVKQHAKLTVKVSAASNAKATGSVKIYDRSKLLKTVPLSAGKASVTLGLLARGTHKLRAVYAGNSAVKGSTSATVTVTVRK